MAQVTTGLRSVLSFAPLYQAFQDLVGARRLYEHLSTRVLALSPGQRLLDIGCGPARILDALPAGVEYYGFDTSEDYIAEAKARYGPRGNFWAARVTDATLDSLPRFDAVIAIGVLHHLDDHEVTALCAMARRALNPNGRLVTYDPCFVPGQHPIARWLVSRDRGQNVRTPEAYAALASAHFEAVSPTVLEGHLRIPYSATVLECSGPRA